MTVPSIDTPPGSSLDPHLVASALYGFVIASAKLGHSTVTKTARDYLRPVTPEARFVWDIMMRSTPEVCDTWLGGVDNACRVGTEMLAVDGLAAR